MIRTLALSLALAWALPLVAADFSFESAGAPPQEGISAEVRGVLAEEGYRVKGPDGSVVAEIWPRKAAFEGAGTSAFGVRYDFIPESALIGVIQFPDSHSDFREQKVPPGAYTLRYSLHPEDGNHMGVAASRDFAVLVPAADDADPNAKPGFDDLIAMTKKIGNPHPTIARLELPEGDESPHLWEDENEHWVFDIPVSGEVVGVVIYGHSEE